MTCVVGQNYTSSPKVPKNVKKIINRCCSDLRPYRCTPVARVAVVIIVQNIVLLSM